MNGNSQVPSFFAGLVVGGLIGAAVALLVAPQSGEQTRTQIRDRGIELREKAGSTYADLQTRVEAAVDDLQARVNDLSARVDQAVAEGREALSRRTVELGEGIVPE
jgi:gas vesicle protein